MRRRQRRRRRRGRLRDRLPRRRQRRALVIATHHGIGIQLLFRRQRRSRCEIVLAHEAAASLKAGVAMGMTPVRQTFRRAAAGAAGVGFSRLLCVRATGSLAHMTAHSLECHITCTSNNSTGSAELSNHNGTAPGRCTLPMRRRETHVLRFRDTPSVTLHDSPPHSACC